MAKSSSSASVIVSVSNFVTSNLHRPSQEVSSAADFVPSHATATGAATPPISGKSRLVAAVAFNSAPT
jgi:hypothetical protein